MTEFLIYDTLKLEYVGGYDAAKGAVKWTRSTVNARRFVTPALAGRFITEYRLSKRTAQVVTERGLAVKSDAHWTDKGGRRWPLTEIIDLRAFVDVKSIATMPTDWHLLDWHETEGSALATRQGQRIGYAIRNGSTALETYLLPHFMSTADFTRWLHVAPSEEVYAACCEGGAP